MHRNFARYQLPVIIWSLLIFISSSIPSAYLPKLDVLRFDKVIHFMIFFTFCALTYRALTYQDHLPLLRKYSLVFSVLFTVAYGVIDELHQHFVPGRNASVLDLAADTLGAVLCVSFIWVFVRWRRQRAMGVAQ